MYKKIIFLLGLLVSGITQAGSIGAACDRQPVTVPCEEAAWDFSADVLFLKPRLPGLSYYGYDPANGRQEGISPDWKYGFKLLAAYHFNSGNDFTMNWYHHTTADGTDLPGSLVDIYGNLLIENVHASFNPRWDAVNFELGQYIMLSETNKLRLHGGVQFSRIKSSGGYNANGFLNTSLSFPGNTAVSRTLVFSGAGPRVGFELAHHFWDQFALYGNTASAILLGHSSFTTGITNGAFQASIEGSQQVLVPEIEGKLGIRFTYPLAQSDLIIDIGGLFVTYFHPLHDGLEDGITAVGNFSAFGPYFGLRWIGSVG